MRKVCAPDGMCREVDGLSGLRYKSTDGMYEMTDRDAATFVKLGGFVPSLAGTARRATGYRCPQCGFGSYFRACSRCGNTNCEKAQ